MAAVTCKVCRTSLAEDASQCFSCGAWIRPGDAPLSPEVGRTGQATGISRVVVAAMVVIGAINCVILFFASLLAVGGDGSASGIFQVWLFGYGWIAIVTVAACMLARRDQVAVALILMLLQLPVGFQLLKLGSQASRWVERHSPDSPQMRQACEHAGVEFIASPPAPVGSIAYDWPSSQRPPQYNRFTLDERGNVSNLTSGAWASYLPKQVEFVESRCCRDDGSTTGRSGEYGRRTNSTPEERTIVPRLTADVVVKYQSTDYPADDLRSQTTLTSIVVVDRRTGQKLAALRYALSGDHRRGCLANSMRELNEREFVLRAIGIGER